METYRIKWKGRESGPYSETELREMLANREIRNLHEVKVAGEWKTVRRFLKELDQAASAEVPAPAVATMVPAAPAIPIPAPPSRKPGTVPLEETISEPELLSIVEDADTSVPDILSREDEGALRAQLAPEEGEKERPPKPKKTVLPKSDLSGDVVKQTRAGEFLVHAGFWYRVLAILIDLAIVYALPLWLLGGLFQKELPVHDPVAAFRELVSIGPLGISLVSLASMLVWFYFAAMESSRRRGTIGKMILGLVVTDERGNQIAFPRASLRFFSKALSALILFAGFFLAAFTKHKQGLHDLISRCTVNHALPPTRLLRRNLDRS